MKSKKIAYLAPEIPSVSATFVYRELIALEQASGAEVVPFSLHRVEPNNIAGDGLAVLRRTRVVYRPIPRVLSGALGFALSHPRQTLRTAVLVVRDAALGKLRRRWRLLPQFVAALHLARELKRLGVEHLHVHFAHAPATVGMYAASAARIPFSVTAHANDIYVNPELLAEKVVRASPFVTISEANRLYLRDKLGPIGERIKLIRCGVNRTQFPPWLQRRGHSILFAAGRLVPKKGFDLLLEAMSVLGPQFLLFLAGDGPERPRLERLVRELGLERNVWFLGAIKSRQMCGWMSRANVFVLPCRRAADGDVDGIPVVLMEAMATGVPVVTVGVSGVPELVIHGETGVLVREGSADSLAIGIRTVLDDARFSLAIATAGLRHVSDEFDLQTNARRLFDVIQAATAVHDLSHHGSLDPGDHSRTPAHRMQRGWHASCNDSVHEQAD